MAISDDDLDACFSTDDFGVEGIFETSGGSVTVNGYFTDPTDAVELNGVRIEASEATFQCRTSETTAVRRDDTLTVDGTEYTVERYQRVGTGVTVFYLS
ncbi:MAG: head-tail joining protein [Pyrinomonadaceae bacterium]|nr:head-tail joining protein [Pyrinomonadaceae bacterium]